MNKILRGVIGGAVLAIGIAGHWIAQAAAQQVLPVQKTFASPDDAIRALHAAVKVHDKTALRDIFGPEVQGLLTGKDVLDKANSQRFAKAMEAYAKPAADGEGRIVLEVGAAKWPFPIPLVKAGSGWRFDTAEGKEEILDRHIGKDELHAIGVCEAYVRAQKQRASAAGDGDKYARRLKSLTPDLSEAAAKADVDGSRPKAYHGYLFKVLTRQGPNASGGRADYVKDGRLTEGFALEAYPDHWGRSGIMTFIVGQDGKVDQRDLGEKTSSIAPAMTEYDPGAGWTPAKDPGIIEK